MGNKSKREGPIGDPPKCRADPPLPPRLQFSSLLLLLLVLVVPKKVFRVVKGDFYTKFFFLRLFLLLLLIANTFIVGIRDSLLPPNGKSPRGINSDLTTMRGGISLL